MLKLIMNKFRKKWRHYYKTIDNEQNFWNRIDFNPLT